MYLIEQNLNSGEVILFRRRRDGGQEKSLQIQEKTSNPLIFGKPKVSKNIEIKHNEKIRKANGWRERIYYYRKLWYWESNVISVTKMLTMYILYQLGTDVWNNVKRLPSDDGSIFLKICSTHFHYVFQTDGKRLNLR